MATNFPTSLDTFTNPLSTDSLASPSHSSQHANLNDAVAALEAKVGINSSAVTTSLDYKVGINTPSGVLQMYAGSAAPTGWLLCNGAEVAIATYGALYAVLGTTYGALTNGSGGAGSTHFRLPDARGRSIVGAGTGTGLTARTLAATGGAESVTLSGAESGTSAHGHGNTIGATTGSQSADHNHGVTVDGTGAVSTGGISANHYHSFSTGDNSVSHAHNVPRGVIATAGTNRAVVSTLNNQAVLYTDGVSANHTHSGSTGYVSSDHSHRYDHGHTGSSGIQSANHSHTVTVTGGVSTATAAAATSAHENMMPFLVLNYIIKT